jgi:hypothetical protein
MSYNNNDYNAGYKGSSSSGRNQGQYRRGWDDRQKRMNSQFGPPSNRACFPSTVLVRTPKGWEEIGTLAAGDEVMGFDSHAKTISVRRIAKRLVHPATTLWEVRTSLADLPIMTTGGHLFLTRSGWRSTSAIGTGDQIVTVDDAFQPSLARVISVRKTGRREPVYNLYTTIDHTYIAGGCVVHNFSHFRLLRTWLHRFFVDPWIEFAPQSVQSESPVS